MRNGARIPKKFVDGLYLDDPTCNGWLAEIADDEGYHASCCYDNVHLGEDGEAADKHNEP